MAGEARPPFVRFEYRSIEDREASVEAGHYVGKDIIYAIVTPVGSRDTIERPVTDWLAGMEEGVRQDRIPQEWLSAYRRALKDFEESRETPEFGTPVKDWPVVSPSQLRLLLDINVRTVEELAEANEETLGRIGMGARALKEKARAWLDSAATGGKVSEKLSKLEVRNTELLADNESLRERLTKLEALVNAQSADKETA